LSFIFFLLYVFLFQFSFWSFQGELAAKFSLTLAHRRLVGYRNYISAGRARNDVFAAFLPDARKFISFDGDRGFGFHRKMSSFPFR